MDKFALKDREIPLEGRIRREAEELAREFDGIVGFDTVHRFMQEWVESARDARLRDFLHIFARRSTRQRLISVARSRIDSSAPVILFVCVRNAGRSQMAAAFAARVGGDRVSALSAGSHPASRVNPLVAQAMSEVGIDLSLAYPKGLMDEEVRAADVIVTMGCGDACPIYPEKRYINWELEDPEGKPIEVVRAIRDEIERRVKSVLEELGALDTASPD